jgi:hypothetical protein
VQLQRAIPMVRNSFKPFFVGRFEFKNGRIVLVGHFTMHWFVKIFMTFWFGFCVLWSLTATLAVMAKSFEYWWFPLGGVAMLGVGKRFSLLLLPPNKVLPIGP